MKIFDKRPLCMILCILLGGFVFFADCIIPIKIIAIAISVISLPVLYFLLRKNKYFIITAVSLVAFLFSSLFSIFYYDCYFNVYDKYNGEVEIVATVVSASNSNNGASTYLRCETINGKRSSHKLYAYIDKEASYEVLTNTRVSFTVLLKDFEEDGDYQDRSFMRSNGYSAEACDIKNFKELETISPTLVDIISGYRTSICEFIIEKSGSDGGGLLCALILGEREFLPFQAQLSFRRCGLSHMLALSGLHLTILTFGISFFLSLMKIRKKPRKVIEIFFVLIYTALTGMPISVIRAAFMHIISSIIFLCSAKADSITSLSISVGIICCVMPYAIYDASLWLSAFATLGVLVYSELSARNAPEKKKSLAKRAFSGMLGGITVSLFSIGTTYLLTTILFGNISLIGAVSTPIISVIITPFMYLGLVFLVVGAFIPIGPIIDAYGSFICKIIRAFSSIKGIYISAEDIITVSLIVIFTVMLILFLVLDFKKKRYPMIVLMAFFTLTNVSAITMNTINRMTDDCIYFCDDNDEYFLLKSKNTTHLIDVSNGSVSDNYSALDHVSSEHITEITSYICTSYSKNTVSSAIRLSSSIYIDTIYLPHPESDAEEAIYSSINNELQGSYTKLKTYTTSDALPLGSFKAIFPFRASVANKCAFLIIDPNMYITCYTSSGMLNDDTKTVASEMISKSNRLILGRHGESYKNEYFILKFNNLDSIIISSNKYSVPPEMQNYYKNAAIYTSVKRMSLIR